MEDDNDDNYNDSNNITSKSEMGVPVNASTSNSGVGNKSANGMETGANAPFYGLDLDFGDALYWNNGTIAADTEAYMLSAIATYSNMDGLHGILLIPKYEFSRGMKEI